MRILYLSPRESWPTNSGAKLRDYYLAHGLAQQAELHYLFFGLQRTAEELSVRLGAASHVDPPDKYTASKIVQGLIGSRPLPILNYTSQGMAAAIEAVTQSGSFDVVHLDSIHMAGYLDVLRKRLPKALITLDWHNIESEAMERFAANTTSRLRKLYARYTASQLKKIEDEMLQHLDGHVVCSERERLSLLRKRGKAKVAVVENGVDASGFSPSKGPRSSRLLFVGQMSYGPNAEGAVWFVRHIWPVLRKRRPELELFLVGADPGPAVQALRSEPCVTVTGTVPEVRPYYEGALAAVVPLRSGAGTRLKILEAMAAGTPVISTALGAEGLGVVDGTHFVLAEGEAGWVRALDRVSQDDFAAALTTEARQLVLERYDWPILGRQLADLYRVWTGHS